MIRLARLVQVQAVVAEVLAREAVAVILALVHLASIKVQDVDARDQPFQVNGNLNCLTNPLGT